MNRKVVILSARRGWHTNSLVDAFALRGVGTDVRTYESLIAHIGSPRSDHPFGIDAQAVLPRIIPHGSLEQIIYRVDALHWLEDRGLRVLNSPRAIERAVDKFYTSALLAEAGVDTPETIVCERSSDAMDAFRRFGDVIVKPLFGSMGLGMVRVSDEDVAWRVFRAIDAIRGVYYVQRAIDHGGCDIRAFVVGDRVIGAMERRPPEGSGAAEWRTNFSRGGRVNTISLDARMSAIAIRAASVVGAAYAGVDLLPARDGRVYALEVNAIPGWRGLEEAHRDSGGLDVAGQIADLLLTSDRAPR